MDVHVKHEDPSPRPIEDSVTPSSASGSTSTPHSEPKPRSRTNDAGMDPSKRRCVSTACIACRKRKSKCDGNLPACAACSSVYGTECVYDPNSDHRRKGVYKKDIDSLKTRNSTLQTLMQALLNSPEEAVPELVRQIRACESLDKVAKSITAKENGEVPEDEYDVFEATRDGSRSPTFESELSSKIANMRLEDGVVRFIGGTSNLIFVDGDDEENADHTSQDDIEETENPTTSWTSVTSDPDLVKHLLNHYFTWHYTFFTILPKSLFFKQYMIGNPAPGSRRKHEYCTPLLVNVMLALGCHFTSHPGARSDPEDSATAGDHFFKEARRLIYVDDVMAKPSLATVQALALMSVREAGCAREPNGWNYSGMAFRMAGDLGLSFQTPTGYTLSRMNSIDDEEEDARRVTFWGCFQIDKCWSNYLGRLPQFQLAANVTIPRYDVFPMEDADLWSPYSDSGFSQAHSQPSRVRAVALQISALCEISGDLIKYFYHPQTLDKPSGKQLELKRLGEVHSRLEEWRRNLPKELEPKEGILSSVLIMHMFFQLLYIHLFRPFLKYNLSTSPLPAHVSPRKICTQAAAMISKLLRLYKRSHGLRQIVNFAVYIAHSACTIHLLNIPDKTAKRDITHGVKHLEEIAEGWLAARRTLSVLSAQARKWKVELPDEAAAVLTRTDSKWGMVGSPAARSPSIDMQSPPMQMASLQVPQAPHLRTWQQQHEYYSSKGNTYNQIEKVQPPTNMAPPQNTLPISNPGPFAYQSTTHFRTPNSTPTASLTASMQSRSKPSQSQFQYVPLVQTSTLPPDPSSRPISQPQPQPHPEQHFPVQQQSLKHPLFTGGDLFGGVESLLRDNQEWWSKDPTAGDLVSGFGNWNNSQNTNSCEANGTSSWMQQQLRQQPQTKEAKSRQGSWPIQGMVPQLNEQRRTSVVGRGGSNGIEGGRSDAYMDGSGTGIGSEYTFGIGTNGYNEDEWYA